MTDPGPATPATDAESPVLPSPEAAQHADRMAREMRFGVALIGGLLVVLVVVAYLRFQRDARQAEALTRQHQAITNATESPGADKPSALLHQGDASAAQDSPGQLIQWESQTTENTAAPIPSESGADNAHPGNGRLDHRNADASSAEPLFIDELPDEPPAAWSDSGPALFEESTTGAHHEPGSVRESENSAKRSATDGDLERRPDRLIAAPLEHPSDAPNAAAAPQQPAWNLGRGEHPRQEPSSVPADEPGVFDPQNGAYTVGSRETYWQISKRLYGTGAYFKALFEHNRARYPSPSSLRPGVVISTPPASALHQAYPQLCPQSGL
jgi:type II secretory pathway pseudopilin PulG